MVPITANILQPLVDVFESILKFFHDSFGASWGLSIILLTIVTRLALLPLAVKQFRSMQAMQRIAPHLRVLQARYKDDKQRLQQETMRFYQEHKVNPFASCLPLVAQLPVFLSLFYMLRKDLRHDICPDINPVANASNPRPCGHTDASQFWFIHDITDKASGSVLIVLLVLYVGTQLVSSLLMMTATADQNQKYIMLAMPFLFVGFVFRFPAGLIMYWITTNLWTICQQQFLRRVVGSRIAANAPPLPELPPVKPGKDRAEAGSGGGFLARLQQSAQPAPKAANGNGGGNGARAAKVAKSDAGDSDSDTRVTKAPPPPPRGKKKKRSGRRR
jgi:YidC/Oxa1 family membrane protein insertase